MAEKIELNADIREATGRRVKHLRTEGLIPAVLYGRDLDSTLLQVDAVDLGKALRVAGTHQLITLKVNNGQPQMTLARDIQRDVVKHDYLHVDFYAVKMDEKVRTQVPLILIGDPPGVTEEGGILTQGLDELEIECVPSELIASIEVDVSGLVEINDTISVSDLDVPGTITVIAEPESMVAKIEPPRREEELEALEEELIEAPVSMEPEMVSEAEEEEEFPPAEEEEIE